MLTACQFLRKGDFPDSVRVSLGDSPESVLMRGGSAIVSPLGKVLAGRIVPELGSGEAALGHDSSTNALIRRYRYMRGR